MSWAGEVPQQLGGVPAACYFPEDASLLPNSHVEMLTVLGTLAPGAPTQAPTLSYASPHILINTNKSQ